jgi:limonene-1,2-epoxide hydrolase
MSEQQEQDTQVQSMPNDVLEQMIEAAHRHDLEVMVTYFAPDYQSARPFTPQRNYTGQAGVRRNWSVFFATMPDFRVEILSAAAAGTTVWTELFFHGTRTDGTMQIMRGVNLVGIHADTIAWGKLYQATVQELPPHVAENEVVIGEDRKSV